MFHMIFGLLYIAAGAVILAAIFGYLNLTMGAILVIIAAALILMGVSKLLKGNCCKMPGKK